MSERHHSTNLKLAKSGLKRNQLSGQKFFIFVFVFAAIGGIIIWRSLAVNPNLPGDLNNDNTVNVTDLSILLSNYGTTNSTADINSDGSVNVIDLSTLLSHYGQTYSGGTSNGTVSFQVNYETANFSQWSGGYQCQGQTDPSWTWGTLNLDTSTIGEGKYSGRIDVPADTSKPTRCEGLAKRYPVYGSDHWYGMMYKFPSNWQEPSSAFWGMDIAQLNYQLIWGAPVILAAHSDKVNLVLNTGFCNDVNSTKPGCTYVSQNGTVAGNVPEMKILPGPIVTSNWYEVIVHAKWTGDASQGILEGWYRMKGQTNWIKSVNLTGYPTIQWSSSEPLSLWQSNPSFYINDKFGVYRGQSNWAVSFWQDNIMDGTDFNSVASRMP